MGHTETVFPQIEEDLNCLPPKWGVLKFFATKIGQTEMVCPPNGAKQSCWPPKWGKLKLFAHKMGMQAPSPVWRVLGPLNSTYWRV